jgi:hypothetical protein
MVKIQDRVKIVNGERVFRMDQQVKHPLNIY